MQQRIDYGKASPAARKAMLQLQAAVDTSGLEATLVELVKIRASQINKCAFCLAMHTRDARAAGISEEKIYLLEAWRHSPLFSNRERAALAWTEALTLLPEQGAPDALYDEVRAEFSVTGIVNLTLAVVAINGWNRLAVGFNLVPPTAQVTIAV
jgi:AhpD family alkylhydroperoxidase